MKKYHALRTLIIIIAILILGFFLYPTGVLKPVKNILFNVSKPFSVAGSYTINRISGFFNNLGSLGDIVKDNQTLIKENLKLQNDLTLLKEAQHENEILKKEIGFYNSQKDLKLLASNVIGRSLSGYLKTIIIDRGNKDGVKVGQAVISEGYLVGTIKDVFENTSEVRLITDYNSLVPVILQDSRGTGILRGGLSGLVVDDIPLNVEIKAGEQVVTSGLSQDMPFGLSVGKVNSIISKKGEIFQKISIESPVKIYYLEFVFVVQ